MRKLGAWMFCFFAITWFSIGGCQRPVVQSPEPMWHGSQRPIPVPAEIQPLPSVVVPPVENPWKPSVAARTWKYIVIHHTASEGGSVASIHAEHLQRKDATGKHWKGIGYHFLVGNGTGMSDGEIEPTFRWKQQMQGAHAGAKNHPEYNEQGIGVCLVGNFDKQKPSAAQVAAIKKLVGVLKREYRIKSSQVIGHRDVKETACPGKHFPMTEVAQSEDVPLFSLHNIGLHDSGLFPKPNVLTVSEGTSE